MKKYASETSLCFYAHQVSTEFQTVDQTYLTVHRSHALVQVQFYCFKLLLIPLATGASICFYEMFPCILCSYNIESFSLCFPPQDDGQAVKMALALGCGLEDTLLHTAGVSYLPLFSWQRGQIWWLIKRQSAVLPCGKMDNVMKGSLAVYAKQANMQHKWPIASEHFLTAYPADIFK